MTASRQQNVSPDNRQHERQLILHLILLYPGDDHNHANEWCGLDWKDTQLPTILMLNQNRPEIIVTTQSVVTQLKEFKEIGKMRVKWKVSSDFCVQSLEEEEKAKQ